MTNISLSAFQNKRATKKRVLKQAEAVEKKAEQVQKEDGAIMTMLTALSISMCSKLPVIHEKHVDPGMKFFGNHKGYSVIHAGLLWWAVNKPEWQIRLMNILRFQQGFKAPERKGV